MVMFLFCINWERATTARADDDAKYNNAATKVDRGNKGGVSITTAGRGVGKANVVKRTLKHWPLNC